MASIAKLVVSLGANISDFQTDMKRASTLSKRELAKMERQAKQLNATWNRNFTAAGAAVAAGLALATKSAIEFEKAMGEVATLGTGNIDRLSDSVRDLAVEFGQAPVDQARALYQIISAGATDAATQIEQLRASNMLAVGGITDVATAADGLTTVLNAYAGTGLEANRATDILFATMKTGKTTIGELSSSIGVVASTAAQVGVSMEELGAAVATVTKATGSTERTMTGLRAAFNAVLSQTPQTTAAAEELGISFDIASRGADGFKELLADIAASNATDEQLKRLFNSTEALAAVLPLLAQEAKGFNDALISTANSAGAAQEAFETMADRTAFKVDQAKAAIENLRIEIGTRFLSSISGVASEFSANIDRMIRAVEIMVAFITGRATIAVVAAFAKMANAGKLAATTMAVLGGAVGASAAALGSIAAIVYDNVAAANQMDFALSALTGTLEGATAEWLANADAIELARVSDAVAQSQQDAADRIVVIAERLAQLKENFGAAQDQLQFSAEFQMLLQELGELTTGIEEADTVLAAIQQTFIKTGSAISDFVDDVLRLDEGKKELDDFGKAVKEADKKLKAIKKTLGEAFAILDIKVEANPFKELAKEIGNFADEVIKGIDPLEDLRDAFEDLLDKLYPGRQLAQDFATALTTLRDGADLAGWSAERLAAAELLLAENFAKANRQIFDQSNGLDILQVALDESVRILSRTFQELFEGIASDAFDAWEAIQSGFESLAATIARTPINVVIKQIGDAFGEGGGGLSDLQLSGQFGQNLLASIGSIIGFGSADSVFGQVGSSLGQLFGKQLFAWAGNAFFPTLFQALGAWSGPIGIALGAIIGSVVGDWIGDVFGRDLQFTLGGANQRTLPDNQQIRTPLADILGLAGQGDFGSLNDPSTFGGKLAEALVSFDTEIANIFKAIGLDDETFNAVVESLENWTATFGESADAVDVLSSRFRTILSNFSTDIRNFVNGAEDFEEQIQRFGVALTAEKLVSENAEIFGDRTTADLLNVLEQFQTGAESIGETFERFLPVLNAVIGISQSLRDFAGSDPLADLDALINPLSLEQSLANVNSGILDLIANFDGSIEQFQAIGELALVARQGELQLLQQIDSIQKGLTARLQSLRDFVTGADNAPKSIAEVLAGAEGLIGKVRGARSASEVAAIGQEFDALIRTLDESQRFKAQGDLLGLINLFEGASSQSLAALRADTLENAATVREAVDLFLTEIGDPLDIIAGSLEGQNLPEVMEGGLEDINLSVQQIGPQVAGALSEVFGDGINVTVVVQDAGLVTQ